MCEGEGGGGGGGWTLSMCGIGCITSSGFSTCILTSGRLCPCRKRSKDFDSYMYQEEQQQHRPCITCIVSDWRRREGWVILKCLRLQGKRKHYDINLCYAKSFSYKLKQNGKKLGNKVGTRERR